MKIFQYVVLLPANDIVSFNVYFLLIQNYWEKIILKKGFQRFWKNQLDRQTGGSLQKREYRGKRCSAVLSARERIN